MITYCYVAVHEDGETISCSNTLEGILEVVDEYMGNTERHNYSAKRLEFVPFEPKWPDQYEGYFPYSFTDNDKIEKVKIYIHDFNYKA